MPKKLSSGDDEGCRCGPGGVITVLVEALDAFILDRTAIYFSDECGTAMVG